MRLLPQCSGTVEDAPARLAVPAFWLSACVAARSRHGNIGPEEARNRHESAIAGIDLSFSRKCERIEAARRTLWRDMVNAALSTAPRRATISGRSAQIRYETGT